MVRLIEIVIALMFVVGVNGCINGWNVKVVELIGFFVEEVMGKFLVYDFIYKEFEEVV